MLLAKCLQLYLARLVLNIDQRQGCLSLPGVLLWAMRGLRIMFDVALISRHDPPMLRLRVGRRSSEPHCVPTSFVSHLKAFTVNK